MVQTSKHAHTLHVGTMAHGPQCNLNAVAAIRIPPPMHPVLLHAIMYKGKISMLEHVCRIVGPLMGVLPTCPRTKLRLMSAVVPGQLLLSYAPRSSQGELGHLKGDCGFRSVTVSQETFEQYQRSTGFGAEARVAGALAKWGPNRFVVPLPSFRDMLKEQLVAPFFVFQVFCVGLWCLDDYW